MKLTCLFSFLIFTVSWANTFMQETRLNIRLENVAVKQLIQVIEEQTEFYFLYQDDIFKDDQRVSIRADNESLYEVLRQFGRQASVVFEIADRQIILKKRLRENGGNWLLQKKKVTGIVADKDRVAIPGVSILIKGTTIGTTTGMDGSYTLPDVLENSILVFSFVGMNTQEVVVGERDIINVVLEAVTIGVDEVVVTALGIRRETKTLTYSSQGLDGDELISSKGQNVVNSISGKVAGVQISKTNSGPGSSSRVLIRGNRSIGRSNQPLYVIDGVPVDNTVRDPGNENGGFSRGDGISNINPDDIESMNVLKGSSAAAIYGSRAANGVIVITTKSGSGKKGLGIEISSSFSFEQPRIYTEFQNEYGQGIGGVYDKGTALSWGARLDGSMVEHWSMNPADVDKVAYKAYPDNYKNFYRNGTNLTNSVAFSLGKEKTNVYFSFTNQALKGIVENNDLEKHNVNMRIFSKITDGFTLDAKFNYVNQKLNNRPATGETFENIARQAIRLPRNVSVRNAKTHISYVDENKNLRHNLWQRNPNGEENPFWLINYTPRLESRNRIIGFVSLRYDFSDAVSLQLRYGMDRYFDKNEFKWYSDTYTVAPFGRYEIENVESTETNADFLLSYIKTFGNFSVNTNVGGNLLKKSYSIQNFQGREFYLNNIFLTTNFKIVNVTTNPSERELHSLYGFGQIGYKEFLFVDVSARDDWPSTLPAANRPYFYYSAGFTFIFTEAVELPAAISFAKVRGSYARVGNDAAPYLTQQFYSFKEGKLSRDGVKPIEDLKPEITSSYEFGADIRLFGNRLGLDFTCYNTLSKNQLLQVSLPPASGWSSQYINAGEVQNKGVELILSTTPVKTKNLTFDLDFNFAKNTNKVKYLTETVKTYVLGGGFMTRVVVEEGKPYGEIYGRALDKDVNGNVLIDNNGLPVITSGMTERLGNFNPDWIGGIKGELSYKNFSLGFLFDFKQGGTVLSFTNANLYGDGLAKGTLAGRNGSLVLDGVTSGGSKNTKAISSEAYWSLVGGRNTPVAELFAYDASNARLRELNLSYRFPSKLFRNTPVKSVKLSLLANNVFFLYNKAGGFDPEQTVGATNMQGIESFSLPTTRSFGFNLNVKF